MAQGNLPSVKIHIPILDIADSSGAAAAIEQEVDDRPAPIIAEVTVLVWLLQKQLQFLVGVSLLHRVLVLRVGGSSPLSAPPGSPNSKTHAAAEHKWR